MSKNLMLYRKDINQVDNSSDARRLSDVSISQVDPEQSVVRAQFFLGKLKITTLIFYGCVSRLFKSQIPAKIAS